MSSILSFGQQKVATEELKTQYRLRACDLIEVLIEKSSSPEALLRIYSTLFTSIQQAKPGPLRERLVSLLEKLSTATLVLTPDCLEATIKLILDSVKVASIQASAPLRNCVLTLAKATAKLDIERVKGAYSELLRLYIEKHTRKEVFGLLTTLLSTLPALADEALAEALLKYSNEAKQPQAQLQALALMKLVLAKVSSKATSKSLKLSVKEKLKKGTALPSKDWVKKAVSVLLVSCKKSGYTAGVARVFAKLENKFAGVVTVQSKVAQAKKLLGLS